MPGLKGPNSKPAKKNIMTTKKKSTKKKSTKTKMTVPQKRKVWNEITPGALVDIKFTRIETFQIDYDGDISTDFGVMLPRAMLSAITSGSGQQFEADDDFDAVAGDDMLYLSDGDGDEYNFNPADPCIHSIVIAQQGTRRARVYLNSIGETMVLEDGSDTIEIGCRSLNKKDAEAAAIAILKWLDWDVIV